MAARPTPAKVMMRAFALALAVGVGVFAVVAGGAYGAITCDTGSESFEHPGEHDFSGKINITGVLGLSIATDPLCTGLEATNDCHLLAQINGVCVELAKATGSACTTSGSLAGVCNSDKDCLATRLFFTTNTTFTGDIGPNLTPDDQDDKCQNASADAGLVGTYYWLGRTVSGVIQHPSTGKILPDPVVYTTVSGTTLLVESAAGAIKFSSTVLDATPNVNEFGEVIADSTTAVWIGSGTSAFDCSVYTSASGGFTSEIGDLTSAAASSDWRTGGGTQTCDLAGRLYCVQGV